MGNGFAVLLKKEQRAVCERNNQRIEREGLENKTMNTKHFLIKKGETLLDAMRREGEYVPAYCGGSGICGKCRVQFIGPAPEPTEAEKHFFSEEELMAGWRLACMTKTEGSADIVLPEEAAESTMEAETGFSLDGGEDARPGQGNLATCQEQIVGAESDTQNHDAAGQAAHAVPRFVVAVDIGTTTLAASLVDTGAQEVLRTVTSVNHQRAFGADVISRMEASNQGKGEQLRQCIQRDIHELLTQLSVSKDTPLVIAGNTTMGHLLQGYSCETLGVAPYTPVDLSLHQTENMTLLPGISTFVGADIVSGVIACGMDQSDAVNLLVDLGTNGEMILGNRQRMIATSTAAGPAFEGGNISCGVAGIAGAISAVDIIDGQVRTLTIGNEPPVGLCGTGVLETVYELLKEEIIDEVGNPSDAFLEQGFALAPEVTFTIGDVREVQLAKAAIRAGIEVMLAEYGITYADVAHVYLAGGFGQKVNIQKAVGIGLLPEELSGKVIAVGNSSLAGAVLYAKNPTLGERFRTVAETTGEIALAENRLFNDLYVEHMFFPEING